MKLTFFLTCIMLLANLPQYIFARHAFDTLPALNRAYDSIPAALLSGLEDPAGLAPPVSRIYSYDSLAVGQEYEVFQAPPCLEGSYLLVYQLSYDLGDRSTTENWTADLEIELKKGGLSLWTKGLHLNMEDQQFLYSVFHPDTVLCADHYTFVIHGQTQSGSVPANNISLMQRMYKINEGNYDPSALFALNYAGIGSNEISVTWDEGGAGVIEYELEWVFIDSCEAFTGTTPPEAFDFNAPVRINTRETYYDLSPYSPKGELWFRVRSVGVNPDYPGHRINGVWQYGPGTPLFIDNPEAGKNWQIRTSFAEDGRHKHVMSYFDGNFRSRQVITNLSSEGYSMVGETLYDYEGRPVLDVAPVPDRNRSLEYKPGFNTFEPADSAIIARTSAIRNKFNYDNGFLENSILSDIRGAGAYYSPSNDFSTIHRDYIPAGKGYAYSQRSFTPDNTGRLRSQSGIGEQFRIDGDHATRFFYGSAAAGELIRLFGSNAGAASHYKKHAVVDPNGQLSISYLDQEGRVVATALAGNRPDQVEGLASYDSLSSDPVSVDISDKHEHIGRTSKTTHRLLNTGPGAAYTFTYDLDALGADVAEIGCQACRYDLKITIRNPKGMPVDLSAIPGNESVSGYGYEKKALTASDCNTATGLELVTIPVAFTEVGEYTLAKELTARKLSFEEVETLVRTKPTVQTRITEIENSYVLDSANCDICVDCDEAEAIIDKAIENITGQNCEHIRQTIIGDIQATQGPDYVVTEEDIIAHADYCHYEFCVKDKRSHAFDIQLNRYDGWSAAVAGGYNHAQDIDPFFNDPGLSGYDYKSTLNTYLNTVTIENIPHDTNWDGVVDTYVMSGPILDITDPNNGSYYLNEEGTIDDEGGYHVLYWDLMSRSAQLSPAEYDTELDVQRWALYKSFYMEAKRRTRLDIPEIQACTALKTALELLDTMPAEANQIEAWGIAQGVTDSVSTVEIALVMDNIASVCNITLNSADSSAIYGYLKAYFDSNPGNVFRLVLDSDLTTDQNLLDIQTVLTSYDCGLGSVAEANPLTCVRDTIVYVPAPGAAQTLTMISTEDLQPAYMEQQEVFNLDSLYTIEELRLQHLTDSIMRVQEQEYFNRYRDVFDKGSKMDTANTTKEQIRNFEAQQEIVRRSAEEDREYIDRHMAKIEARFLEREKLRRKKRQKEMNALINGQINVKKQEIINSIKSDINTGRQTAEIIRMAPEENDSTIKRIEREALIALYNSTDGDNWYGITSGKEWKQNGEFTEDINNWEGVILNENGNIINITLESKNLSGPIPIELGNLGSLEILNLRFNKIIGPLPFELGNLTSLKILDLYFNFQLTGPIPPIGELVNLEVMDFNRTRLTGNIPLEIGNLSNLKYLDLSSNQLTGSIPSEIGNLLDLKCLNLNYTQLTGNIPLEIGNLLNLKYLNLCSNQLTGSIPSEIGNLISLENILLINNQLTGSIPSEIGNLLNLKGLYLDENQLTGSIPSEIGNLLNLEGLCLDENQLEGVIPPEIWNLLNIGSLSLSGNQLTGVIPVEIGDLLGLVYLSLSKNQLTGMIPSEIGNLSNLEFLWLSNNHLEGAIPTEIWNLSSLVDLSLSNNQLTGIIPVEIGDFSELQHLSLSNNQLTGVIPVEIWNLSELMYLALSGNQFTGNIPPEIGNLYNLEELFLSNNQLTSIPPEVGNLENLRELYLNSNQLMDFSVESGGLPSLEVLHLGHNQLTSFSQVAEFNLGQLEELYLNNNLLTDTIFINFDEQNLEVLHLENNQLTNVFSFYSEEYFVDSLYISNNRIGFDGLADIISKFSGQHIEYIPQDSVDIGGIIVANLGDSVSLVANAERNTTPLSKYQWFKYIDGENDIALTPLPTEDGHTYTISSVGASDAGSYYYKVINDEVPDLTLYSKMIIARFPITPPAQRNALIALYNSTDGDNWTGITAGKEWKQNGEFTDDISNWHGITLDAQGFVISIDLTSNNLTGTIPSEIGDIQSLVLLDLSRNQLSGSIPIELFDLLNLEYLNVRWNQLSGSILSEIELLENLKYINLSTNQLTGNIPPQIGNLSNLEQFWLGQNTFIGTIPHELGDLTNLVYLELNQSGLSGEIPSELGGLSNLEHLYLSKNQISGFIPSSLGNLTKLKRLHLAENQITGTIPNELGSLTNLESIHLNNNQLSGAIPPELGNLVDLEDLLLHENQITGVIPPELGNLGNLESLWLSNNQLTGTIPMELGNILSLTSLILGDNQLNGSLPVELSSLTNISALWLNNNSLTGIIPYEFGNLINLTSLVLTQNQFSGVIPNSIGEIASLDFFSIKENNHVFKDIIEFRSIYQGAFSFYYTPQNKVDVSEFIELTIGNSLTLEASVDRNTLPACKYQWLKDGVPITTLDTANHTLIIDNVTDLDEGDYHYIITNEALSALTLISRIKYVRKSNLVPKVICLEYDQNNPTLQQMTVTIDFEQEIAECLARLEHERTILVEKAVETLIEEEVEQFYATYNTNCLANTTEKLSYSYTPKEYHYTLYYYDQAGNLTQTVPPKGVNPLTGAQVEDFIAGTITEPAHTLATRYKYNSLNQLIWQQSPDAGVSRFWYDSKGQLRASQNAKQATGNKYAYTKYDALGRIVEIGEVGYVGAMDKALLDSAQFPDWASYEVRDMTLTHYDLPSGAAGFEQENLRDRVSFVEVLENEGGSPVATYYSYDPHGNVKTLVQAIPGFEGKRTDYIYDLISGNVNYVIYRKGEEDQFIHRYRYDEDNRLQEVYTSTDGFIWDLDADYFYYPHGPLARVELGEYKVQGVDYYYTLQGWIKGVNMPFDGDPGADGASGSAIARDEFAYTLGYYDGDYAPVDAATITTDPRDGIWLHYTTEMGTTGLYNGNISWMATHLPEVGRQDGNDPQQGYQALLYNYDQLHRIVGAKSLTSYTPGSGFGSRTGTAAYDASYSYDPNGNLRTLKRHNDQTVLTHDFNYEYFAGTNRLKKMGDVYTPEVPYSKSYNSNPVVADGRQYRHISLDSGATVTAGSTVDLEATESIVIRPGATVENGATFTASIGPAGQVTIPAEGQYAYDEIGNLISDIGEGVIIDWTPYGKVRKVTGDDGTVV
ncbi:MAG: leucine-rich repeat domain-containing protein, partial [Cytophagales bacterium]|nr:leucine-rich repeat domain-containing protein [Cytophagales bacterium]